MDRKIINILIIGALLLCLASFSYSESEIEDDDAVVATEEVSDS